MKTININLIGEFAKVTKPSRLEIKKDTLDSKTRITVIVFILGTLVILAISFCVWLGANLLAHRAETKLKSLETEFTALKKEEANQITYSKELKERKKIADFKLLAKQQINEMFIPWSEILTDLSSKVPKKIIITDIKKIQGTSGAGSLEISGVVSAKSKPLTEVSFFILNINADKDSLLTNAEIKRLNYEKDSNLYEFEVKAELQKSKAGQDHE